MSFRQDIDPLLRRWPYEPGAISARLVRAADGRQVIQMRIEMGVLQMEMVGRPDGEKPGGAETYLDWLNDQVLEHGPSLVLDEQQCFEVDREFLQFYHRRICCLALRQFARAVADADHTLALMDFVAAHSPEPQWTLSHEQYRPFVLFHRTQAAALLALEKFGPEAAMEAVGQGLDQMHEVFDPSEEDEEFEQNELVAQLVELKESLRKEYSVGKTLAEQLAEAVAAEQYERAARLRDEIAHRREKTRQRS